MKIHDDINNKSAGKIIGELYRAAHVYFQHEFSKYSIGHSQIRTLFFITKNEGLTQREIAKELGLDKSSVTSQLQLLEKNGYIRRNTSPRDARVQEITITDKTKEMIAPIKMVLASWTDTMLDGFTENERNELFAYLERMKKNSHEKLRRIKSDNS